MPKDTAHTTEYEDARQISSLLASGGGSALVPIESQSLFVGFAMEVVREIATNPGDDLFLCVDGYTVRTVDQLDRIRALADHVFVLGETTEKWSGADNVEVLTASSHGAFSLVVLSTAVSIALHFNPRNALKGHRSEHSGGWTADRKAVAGVAESLLGNYKNVRLPRPNSEAVVRWTPHLDRLTTVFARLASFYQSATTVERDDLFSVLEILKAISSRRRSHDVLFAFVEQISRVIEVDRCSVVRIWNSDDYARVVASHDDASVKSLLIDLAKYPELRWSLDRFEKVVVNSVASDPLTESCEGVRGAGIQALLVIPIVLLDANVGSLFLRVARKSKSFSPREVGFCEIVAEAASNALERAYLLERLQKANERLERLAVTDELTGLHNHRYFRERFADEFDRARRYSLPLSCIILDIDDFKRINDSFGHLQGDNVLREIAACAMRQTRRSDIVARYGGEEFIIIMPQTSKEGARIQAERIRQSVAAGQYRGVPEDTRITVSAGLAELNHAEMLDSESLIRVADSALYEAKRNGKNQVVVGTIPGEHK